MTKGFERGGTELDSGRNARGTRKPLCVSRTIIICEIVVKLRDIEWLLMMDISSSGSSDRNRLAVPCVA